MKKIITAVRLLIFNRSLFISKVLKLIKLDLDTLKILKFSLLRKIFKLSKGKVLQGPYRDLDFSVSIDSFIKNELVGEREWRREYSSYYNQLLMGFYELDVVINAIALAKKYKLNHIINFGTADGIHLIGLVKNKIFKNGIGFEKDSFFRKLLIKNSIKNRVSNKVKVFADINISHINKCSVDLKKTLFIIDVDGYEFKLFSEKNIPFFKDSYLIIEFHPRAVSNKLLVNKFLNLINNYFKVSVIKDDYFYNNKIPYNQFFEQLTDDERWILLSGSRGSKMSWLQLTPKH